MIVEIKNEEGSGKNELCICEFQGEITGELKGNDLGCITLLEVLLSPIHLHATPLTHSIPILSTSLLTFLLMFNLLMIFSDFLVLKNGKAEIGIGLHQLEGQIVTLKLPFLVLEKKRKHNDSHDEKESRQEQEPTMKVLGIARKKILFKSRPKNSNSLKK